MKTEWKNAVVILSAVAVSAFVLLVIAYLYDANVLPLGFYYPRGTITIFNGASSANQSVWIAAAPSQQAIGMMWRQDFGGAYGMLFVFSGEQQLCFWMKNTEIPLRQVWINATGYVVYAYNATPYDTTTVCAGGEYVLETPLNSSIGLGDRIRV